jgi:nicotinamide mononucleotide transporter
MKTTKNLAIKKYFADWTTFEKTWLTAFSIITITLFFWWNDTIIGLGASLTGMLCVILTAKGKISNYYFGIINCILYAYVAYQSRFYGEVILNILYFLPAQFLGIYYWKQHINRKKTKDDVIVEWFSWKERITWIIITITGTAGAGIFLKAIGSDLPYIGAFTAIMSIIAMILTIKRVAEEWILWIIVDIVTIYMWFYSIGQGGNDISVLIMWIAFLTNAIYGFINWIKLAKEAKE